MAAGAAGTKCALLTAPGLRGRLDPHPLVSGPGVRRSGPAVEDVGKHLFHVAAAEFQVENIDGNLVDIGIRIFRQ